MNQISKDIILPVVSGIITAILLGIAGYVFIVKENQMNIKQLRNQIDNHKIAISKNNNKISSNQIIIVAAHPEKADKLLNSNAILNISQIDKSLRGKISKLNIDEINVLVSDLNGGNLTVDEKKGVKVAKTASSKFVINKYKLDKNDIFTIKLAATIVDPGVVQGAIGTPDRSYIQKTNKATTTTLKRSNVFDK